MVTCISTKSLIDSSTFKKPAYIHSLNKVWALGFQSCDNNYTEEMINSVQ